MNTSEVAKLLGVSASTIQRWVKQLELPMERNERGHYFFNQADIELLKTIKAQIQNGTILHEIVPFPEKKQRKGTVRAGQNDNDLEKLYTKVSELEISLNAKADSVTSYQLLQHRREIEELQNQVNEQSQLLETLQQQLDEIRKPAQIEKTLVFDQGQPKRKKKNMVRSLFGF